ncbi:hypothetical protein ACMFMG_005456 [Clarireedia jacksonii]
MFGASDLEGYPVEPWRQYGERSIRHNFARWTNHFAEISEKLPKLRVFRFGAGVWDDGKDFDGMKMSNFGLQAANYTTFNCGLGPTPWIEINADIKRHARLGEEEGMEGDKRLLAEEADLEKDVTEYDELMKILDERRLATSRVNSM